MLQLYHPSKPLENFVVYFFSIKWKRIGKKQIINEFLLPTGNGYMGFQFRGRIKIQVHAPQIEHYSPRFYTIGQQDYCYNMSSDDPEVLIYGAIMKPTALYHLFGLDMPSVTLSDIPTPSLFEDKLISFSKQFDNSKFDKERIELVERLLMYQYQKVKPTTNLVDLAINLMHNSSGCSPIGSISKKLNMSERYFQKKFKAVVGITPSAYNRIIRFNYLFAEINAEDPKYYQMMSALSNYYDFAHFSKDFKKYCRISPSNFHIEKFNFLKQYMVDNPVGIQKSTT